MNLKYDSYEWYSRGFLSLFTVIFLKIALNRKKFAQLRSSMSVPTDKNPRIIVAEIAIRIMTEASKVRIAGFRATLSKEQINEIIRSINSHIQQLKYSYMSDKELIKSELVPEIAADAEKIFDSYTSAYTQIDASGKQRKMSINEANVIWASRLLMRFPDRLKEPFRPTIEAGIDMIVVGVRSIVPIPGTNLFSSKVYDGNQDFNVVTNLTTLKAGMKVGVAFLPAASVGGEVSEAMYLGDNEYPEDVSYGTPIYEGADFGGVRNILKQEFMKKGK